MPLTIDRPTGLNVGANNPGTTVYIGNITANTAANETTDGSIRLILDTLSNVATVEARTDGVWNLTEFLISQASLNLGRDVRLSAAGHHVVVTDIVVPQQSFLPETPYDDTGTMAARTPIIGSKLTRAIIQPDESGSLTTTHHSTVFSVFLDVLNTQSYLKTGITGASADVSFILSAGIPPNDIIFFQQNYPPSKFPANSEVQIAFTPGVEFDIGEQINSNITSDNAFTILYDATLTLTWFALDFQEVGHEDLLTETLVLSNDLSITFSNNLELVRPNKDLIFS